MQESAITGYNNIAHNYHKGRPEYPPEAIEALVKALGLQAGKQVLDLAAGTGKLAQALAGYGLKLCAVEPVEHMRAVCAQKVPGIEVLEGSAEAIPLPDASCDIVVVGTAFHWFDGPQALAEIARVCKPHAKVGLIWNIFDTQIPWVHEIRQLLQRYEQHPTHDTMLWQEAFKDTKLFTQLEHKQYKYSFSGTVDDVLARVFSSVVMGLLPEHEKGVVVQQVRDILEKYPETRGKVMFEIPYRVEIYWCSSVT